MPAYVPLRKGEERDRIGVGRGLFVSDRAVTPRRSEGQLWPDD